MNQDLNEVISHLQNQINVLNERLQQLLATNQPAEEHQNLTFNIQRAEDVSLHLFKTLPEFTGDRATYATWRSIAKTAMNLLENHKTSMQYCQALMITRNKITGAASHILNNYNTPFNFEAIIARLDFTYADKRPLHILEEELLVLQQNQMSINEFFDKINEKLNAIVNKINMTYTPPAVVKAFIDNANEKALRTFTTGLNHRRGEILYASNPTSLPEAYAKLQTIIHDQERMKFANQYNRRGHQEHNQEIYPEKNPRCSFCEPQTQNIQSRKKIEPKPMNNDHSSTKVHIERQQYDNQRNPMSNYASKRSISHQGMSANSSSQQYINNIRKEEIIQHTAQPINFYKNQIHIEKSTEDSITTKTIFPGYVTHTIKYTSPKELSYNISIVINPRVVNGIFTSEENIFHIKKIIQDNFPCIKKFFIAIKTKNITDKNEQIFLITKEHEQAHRNHHENFLQLHRNTFSQK